MVHAGDRLSEGTPVEVRNGLGIQFAPGFEVSSSRDDGYLLRRMSDGAVLPVVFPPDSVRPAITFARR